MSVYNGGSHLADALDSILAQTFRDFEFLIIDDGSTDKTADILADYARRDSRIKVRHQAENRGLTASLNGLLAEAEGTYLARMDADDVCLPERFARQVEWLEGHPECGIVGSAYQFINMDGSMGPTFHFENDHHFLQWYLCFQNPLAHPGVMGRTELFRAVEGYRERFRYGQDFDLWWRLSFITRLSCLPDRLVWVRRNPEGLSGVYKAEQMDAKREILAEMLPKIGARVTDLPVHGPSTPPQARGDYIRNAYSGFSLRPDVPASTLDRIRQDAAARFGVLFLQHPFAGARFLVEALKLDPILPFRAAAAGLQRLLARNIWNPILR